MFDACANTLPVQTSHTQVRLAADTPYAWRVHARNQNYLGEGSDVVIIRTSPATQPGAPRGLALDSATGGALNVLLTPPLDIGGVALLEYAVWLRVAGGSDRWTLWIDATAEAHPVDAATGAVADDPTTLISLEGLVASTTYELRAQAITALGNTTLPGTVNLNTGSRGSIATSE